MKHITILLTFTELEDQQKQQKAQGKLTNCIFIRNTPNGTFTGVYSEVSYKYGAYYIVLTCTPLFLSEWYDSGDMCFEMNH